VLSGATCAVTLGYMWHNNKEMTDQEGEPSDPEESGLLSQLKPPLYTVKILKVSIFTSGAYLTWRLFWATAKVTTFYGISLGTLLLNKTSMTIGSCKLGSILAATGCFCTTAYFMQSVGSEIGCFLLCNTLVSIPAAYCISKNISARQELISRELTNIRESRSFQDVLATFSQQNLETQWMKYDPQDKGLKVEKVKKIVDVLVGNALSRAVDSLEEQCSESIPMKYILGSIGPLLKDQSRVEKLSSSIFEKIESTSGDTIYRKEFLVISETSIRTLREMFSQSMSITGAIGLARKFNRIGG